MKKFCIEFPKIESSHGKSYGTETLKGWYRFIPITYLHILMIRVKKFGRNPIQFSETFTYVVAKMCFRNPHTCKD